MQREITSRMSFPAAPSRKRVVWMLAVVVIAGITLAATSRGPDAKGDDAVPPHGPPIPGPGAATGGDGAGGSVSSWKSTDSPSDAAEYWTEERMRGAQPYPMGVQSAPEDSQQGTEPAEGSAVPGSPPDTSGP